MHLFSRSFYTFAIILCYYFLPIFEIELRIEYCFLGMKGKFKASKYLRKTSQFRVRIYEGRIAVNNTAPFFKDMVCRFYRYITNKGAVRRIYLNK